MATFKRKRDQPSENEEKRVKITTSNDDDDMPERGQDRVELYESAHHITTICKGIKYHQYGAIIRTVFNMEMEEMTGDVILELVTPERLQLTTNIFKDTKKELLFEGKIRVAAKRNRELFGMLKRPLTKREHHIANKYSHTWYEPTDLNIHTHVSEAHPVVTMIDMPLRAMTVKTLPRGHITMNFTMGEGKGTLDSYCTLHLVKWKKWVNAQAQV
tara:strand:+ start:1453 stop:2097 length:645 start_codon:yes stop_codon:yes gene_type:complete